MAETSALYNDDSSDDIPQMPAKKTKGRVKIKMEFIDNKLRRYTTFSKRKTGIMKKAYELSTLTGTQVMLLVASETGHVYTFATRKLQPMITSESGKALIQTCLNSPDCMDDEPTNHNYEESFMNNLDNNMSYFNPELSKNVTPNIYNHDTERLQTPSSHVHNSSYSSNFDDNETIDDNQFEDDIESELLPSSFDENFSYDNNQNYPKISNKLHKDLEKFLPFFRDVSSPKICNNMNQKYYNQNSHSNKHANNGDYNTLPQNVGPNTVNFLINSNNLKSSASSNTFDDQFAFSKPNLSSVSASAASLINNNNNNAPQNPTKMYYSTESNGCMNIKLNNHNNNERFGTSSNNEERNMAVSRHQNSTNHHIFKSHHSLAAPVPTSPGEIKYPQSFNDIPPDNHYGRRHPFQPLPDDHSFQSLLVCEAPNKNTNNNNCYNYNNRSPKLMMKSPEISSQSNNSIVVVNRKRAKIANVIEKLSQPVVAVQSHSSVTANCDEEFTSSPQATKPLSPSSTVLIRSNLQTRSSTNINNNNQATYGRSSSPRHLVDNNENFDILNRTFDLNPIYSQMMAMNQQHINNINSTTTNDKLSISSTEL